MSAFEESELVITRNDADWESIAAIGPYDGAANVFFMYVRPEYRGGPALKRLAEKILEYTLSEKLACIALYITPDSELGALRYILAKQSIKRVNRWFDHLQADTRRLLEHIGAYEKFGRNGWGRHANKPIFSQNNAVHATKSKIMHDNE